MRTRSKREPGFESIATLMSAGSMPTRAASASTTVGAARVGQVRRPDLDAVRGDVRDQRTAAAGRRSGRGSRGSAWRTVRFASREGRVLALERRPGARTAGRAGTLEPRTTAMPNARNRTSGRRRPLGVREVPADRHQSTRSTTERDHGAITISGPRNSPSDRVVDDARGMKSPIGSPTCRRPGPSITSVRISME